MSRNTDAHIAASTTTTRREATGTTDANGEWRDEHGNKINGGIAGAAGLSGAAGVAGAAGATTRVEQVTKVTTVKQVPDTDRHDSAYVAAGGATTGSAASRDATYTSSATAGRVGTTAGSGRDIHVERDHTSTTTSSGGRSTGASANRQTHDYSPERRRDVVSGGATTRTTTNYNTNRDYDQDTTVRNRSNQNEQYGSSRTQAGAPLEGGVYRGDTRGQWNERQENTHGWRAERLSEDQMLEGTGKPMMLDAVAGTRNTRQVVTQQPYDYRRFQETMHTYGNQMVAGQSVEHWLKYLLLIPLALMVPLFLASLIGIPLLGKLIPWATLFPFLKGIGHFSNRRQTHREVSHSRLHRGLEIKPSSLYEETGTVQEAYCVPIQWETLLKNQKWYDVVLVASDNTQVLAHKVVLAARSPVLEHEIDALIARGTKQNDKDDLEVCSHARPCKLTLKNVDGKLLKNFVEFLYSGRVADRNRVEDLLALGQAFEVVDLQDSAAEELIYTLDDGTVGEALILGHDNNHCGLRKAAKTYIRENWKQVHSNSHFKRAVARRPSVLSDDYIHSDREERACHLVASRRLV